MRPSTVSDDGHLDAGMTTRTHARYTANSPQHQIDYSCGHLSLRDLDGCGIDSDDLENLTACIQAANNMNSTIAL